MPYKYPKTITEMESRRSAEMAALVPAVNRLPAERPVCPGNAEHGYMVLSPGHTYEQKFCGTWYRCPICTSSELYPSRDLCVQTGEAYFDGARFERWNGAQWVPA